MKFWAHTISLFCVFHLVVGLQAQQSFDQTIISLIKAEEIDSVYSVMDNYAEQYRSNAQWDSLLYVEHQRANHSFRFKSLDIVFAQIEEAEKIAAEYVKETSPLYLDFLEFVSDVKQDIGAYQESEKILDKIISIGSTLKEDTLGIVESAISEKAFLYLYLGKVEEANKLARSVYKSIKARGDTTKIMSMLQALSMSYQWLNNIDEAIKYNTENLKLIQAYHGENHPNVGLMLSQMAGMYTDKGQFNEAIENYNKSKEIHLYNYRKSGTSRLLGNAIGNMGDFYTTMGEYRLAIDHMTYSLELEKKEYGENSCKVRTLICFLTQCCSELVFM